jgi:hypothetical protein
VGEGDQLVSDQLAAEVDEQHAPVPAERWPGEAEWMGGQVR